MRTSQRMRSSRTRYALCSLHGGKRMSVIFITVENLINKWCTSLMALEELLIQVVTTGGSSFAGAAIFWYIQCPNKRCCQLSTVRKAVERPKE